MKKKLLANIIAFNLFLLIMPAGIAQPDSFIREFVNDTAFKHASVSVCIIDGKSGEFIAGHNKDMALGSASVMKLVTTAVALETMGPDFRFITRMGYTGTFHKSDSSLDGYIVIKGGGDPSFMSEYAADTVNIFDSWADSVWKAGIREVRGSVVADASVFDYHPVPGGWSWSDMGNYYGAGAHGICIYDNMYRIHLASRNEGSIPVINYTEPFIPGLIIENRLFTYGNKDNGYVYLPPYGNHAVLRGEIPAEQDDFILKASIPDPPLFSAVLFQKALEEKGIKFDYSATSLRLSPSLTVEYLSMPKKVLISRNSPPLSEIIRITNTESVNLYAEQLLKYIAYLRTNTEQAGCEAGIAAVKEYLGAHLGTTEGLYMDDGSGLSRYNAISSSFITSLLYYMASESRYSGYYLESLPEAGKTGTLKYYFRDPVFEGKLRAKSGTATRIRNYAGYLDTEDGSRIIFAILVNNFDCTSNEVTKKVEKLLRSIYLQ